MSFRSRVGGAGAHWAALFAIAACGGGAVSPGATTGASGTSAGVASGGVAATGATGSLSASGSNGSGAAASSGGSGAAAGDTAGSGTAPQSGTASGTAAPQSGAATGAASGSGSTGSGSTGSGNSGSGASGPDASTVFDASPPPPSDASHSNKVLIYGVATGFNHASIPAAANAIAQAATAAGLSPVIVPAGITNANNTVPVPADFTPQALAGYGAVVLVACSGEPFGTPGTAQIQALVDFVTGGGGLVAIEDANHSYDTATANPSTAYVSLIGGDFNGHSGYGAGTCAPMGTNPAAAMLPATFAIVDEVYYYNKVSPDIQVVLNCYNTGATPRPVSWVRTQGAGRVFYTGLGHDNHSWTGGPLVPQHILPALLWTMGR
jgi:type 1 glutamine amidotransferase